MAARKEICRDRSASRCISSCSSRCATTGTTTRSATGPWGSNFRRSRDNRTRPACNSASWPDLFRPSTIFSSARQDVDGRDKHGHDELGLIVDGMDRRRHHSRHPPPRRGACGRRADDRGARPPSRAGARRRLAQGRPLLQPGNSVRAVWRARLDEHLGSYTLEATRIRTDRLMGSAAASYRHADDRRAAAAAARARPASGAAPRARHDPRSSRRSRGGGRVVRALRAGAARRTRLRPRPRNLRRHRSERGPDLRLAEIGPRGFARRRRAMEGPAAAAAGISDRGPGLRERGRNRSPASR